jgi:hypothetical protein
MLFHGTQILVLDDRWPLAARSLGLERYQAIIDTQEHPISRTSITRVHRFDPDAKDWPGGIFLKKIIARTWLQFFLRPAKAYLETANYRHLRRIGIPTPNVLAIGQRRIMGSLIDAFLLTEGIVNAVTLEEYVGEVGIDLHAQATKEIFRQLVDIVRAMHRANFFHVDLQWRNVMVQRNVHGIKLFLIDCPRGGKRWFYLRRYNGIMHDLAGLNKLGRLYLTKTQRLRWYRQYVGGRRLNRYDKKLIRRVIWENECRRPIRETTNNTNEHE